MLSTNIVTELLTSRWVTILTAVLLAMFYGLFAYAHLLKFWASKEWSLLLFSVSEMLIVIFYVFRNKPKTISIQFSDWFIAFMGTSAPLLLRPDVWGVIPDARFMITIGAMLQLMSMISLNRSFAIVASKREIKTTRMYRIVRHPLYASYFLIFLGYLLSNTTLANGVIVLVTIFFLCLRMVREEQHLALDPVYLDYMLKVRYRLLPYVY